MRNQFCPQDTGIFPIEIDFFQCTLTHSLCRLLIDVPEKTEELKLVAYFSDVREGGSAYAETTAYAAYAPHDRRVHRKNDLINLFDQFEKE